MIDSAGLLLWRSGADGAEVLLAHMGGPYFAKKDDGGWTVPKGIAEDGESDLLRVAEREFAEELGSPPPAGQSIELGAATSGGKRIHLYARQAEFDAENIESNTFELEWPPRSGTIVAFPEVDRAAWFTLREAEAKLAKNQRVFVSRLQERLDDLRS